MAAPAAQLQHLCMLAQPGTIAIPLVISGLRTASSAGSLLNTVIFSIAKEKKKKKQALQEINT